MATTHVLTASFTATKVGVGFPTIPSLRSLIFFGTGADANEGNRVAGGPAPSILQGIPVHGTNFVSVGTQPHPTPTRNDVIDTNNPRDATWIASGWTYMACCRSTMPVGDPQAGNYAVVFSEQNQAVGSANVTGFGLRVAGVPGNQIVLFANGINGTTSLALSQSIGNWHIVACVVPANPIIGSNVVVWEFTENLAGQSIQRALTTALSAGLSPPQSPHLGAHSSDNAVGQGGVDVAWALVAQAPLGQTLMAQIAAAARSMLAKRGVVC